MLTVPRARPVAAATSPAVIAPPSASCASTRLLVSPGAARGAGSGALRPREAALPALAAPPAAGDPLGRLAGAARREGLLGGAGALGGEELPRGSRARSVRRSLSTSPRSWSRRSWISLRKRSINGRNSLLDYGPAILVELRPDRSDGSVQLPATRAHPSREYVVRVPNTPDEPAQHARPHQRLPHPQGAVRRGQSVSRGRRADELFVTLTTRRTIPRSGWAAAAWSPSASDPSKLGRAMTPLKTRILLADDHALVRRRLRLVLFLDVEPDLEVVAEAAGGARRSSSPSRPRSTWRSSTSRCRG